MNDHAMNGGGKASVDPFDPVFLQYGAQEMVDATELTGIGVSNVCSEAGVCDIKRVDDD